MLNEVHFSEIDKDKVLFLKELLKSKLENPNNASFNDSTITCLNNSILMMIKRFIDNKTSVLPFKQERKINWLVLSASERSLIKHFAELKDFLIPYYVFDQSQSISLFDPSKGKLGKIGSSLLPYGYYILDSSLDNEASILDRLELWSKLDDRRPEIEYAELEVSAFSLRNKFQQAISLKDWSEAKNVLLELSQGHHVNDENLKFLHLQLLSVQLAWNKIWESKDYELISGLESIPRKVKYTLLNSFYQCVLAESDVKQKYHLSFEKYQQSRERLGTITRNQLGLDEEEALRIFAYEAAYKRQEDKLHRYLEKSEDTSTQTIIKYLLDIIEENTQKTELTLEGQALIHYQQQEFEDAFILLLDCPLSLEKVKLLTGIAVMHETEETYVTAYEEYQKLDVEMNQQLLSTPDTKAQIKYVLNWNEERSNFSADIVSDSEFEIHTWNDWFDAFLNGYNIDLLDKALNSMDVHHENINWTLSMLGQLSEQLVELPTELSAAQKALIQIAIPMFINELLQDRHHPNQRAIDVYEYALETLLINCKKNEDNTKLFIRLLDGILYLDITRINEFWKRVSEWFNFQPTLRLSNNVLETLELFWDYGLSTNFINELWIKWMSSLVEHLTKKHMTQIESWVEIGKAISADSYIINRLEEILEEDREIDSLLNIGPMTITIFSLREQPARRAAQRMMTRNPSLDIRVCTNDRLTTESKSYAQNSDLVILVTTCMSHALTYGISPYLRDNIVYARSSGQTSIVEALENHAQDEYREEMES